MSAKNIITPVLKFWGFKEHPFDDRVLRGSELELFVNRKTEVRRLQNALSNPLSGVFGAQGAGKSSVLYKLEEWAVGEGYPVVVAQMSGTSEKLDEKDMLILQFLELNGARSPSDEDLSKAVGLSRVQRGRRLNELAEKGLLRVEEQSSGKTKKYIYYLVEIDGDG